MFEKVVSYLSRQLDIPPESITEETTFESLHLDSLDTVEMLMDMEKDLNVDLEIDDKLETVGELVKLVESKLD